MRTRLLVGNQPTKQQLLDYANAVIAINSYAYAVTNQGLPVLTHPPSDYGSFSTQFATAKQHTLDWTTNIFPSMLQLPVTIQNQAADLFNMESTMIEAYLNVLMTDPTNQKAKTGLASSLSTLVQLIQNQVKAITDIENNLNSFGSNIYNDAQILTNISQDATKDAQGDKDLIAKLNASIAQMNQQISNAQTVLTLSEIGIALGIFVALIGLVCCIIPGAQGIGIGAIVIGIAGTAAGIAFTVIESDNIKALQKEIDGDQKEISDLNQDIILLNNVSTQFNNLYNLNMQAQTALTTIKTMWTNLAATITDVSNELTATENDVTAAQYQQALTDFQAAETNWNEVVAFATALAGLSYNWQDAQGNWHTYSTQAPGADAGQVNNVPSGIGKAA